MWLAGNEWVKWGRLGSFFWRRRGERRPSILLGKDAGAFWSFLRSNTWLLLLLSSCRFLNSLLMIGNLSGRGCPMQKKTPTSRTTVLVTPRTWVGRQAGSDSWWGAIVQLAGYVGLSSQVLARTATNRNPLSEPHGNRKTSHGF
jgi:hypothetical protein